MFIPMGFYKSPGGGTPPFVPTDSDAGVYITRVENDGGTLSNTEKEAIDDLYIGLKADGAYSSLGLLYLFMGGTPSSTRIEAISPNDSNTHLTYDGALLNPANHSSAGITKFTGETGKALSNTSGVDIITNVNEIFMGVKFTQNAGDSASSVIWGNYTSNDDSISLNVFTNGSSTGTLQGWVGSFNTRMDYTNGYPTSALWEIYRGSGSFVGLLKNGTYVDTDADSNSGAFLSSNKMFGFYEDNLEGTMAVGWVGRWIGSIQAIAVRNRINTFLTAIGR